MPKELPTISKQPDTHQETLVVSNAQYTRKQKIIRDKDRYSNYRVLSLDEFIEEMRERRAERQGKSDK